MARLKRQTPIRQARINLPSAPDIGPAIAGFGASVANMAGQRREEMRLKEATEAAEAMVFERDQDGNLIAPSLPTADGLVGPTIYEAAYTDMVLNRYVQQVELDAAKRLQLLAIHHEKEPGQFNTSAQAYVEATLERVLPQVRGAVKTALESRAIGHYNYIARERAEWDKQESKAMQAQKMDDVLRNIRSTASLGTAVPEQVLALAGNVDEFMRLAKDGIERRFWTADMEGEALRVLNQTIAVSLMIGDMENVPNTREGAAEAIARLRGFAEGDGQIRMYANEAIQMVDIAEVFPDPEMREAIIQPLISKYAARESARSEYELARFDAMQGQFEQFFRPSLLSYIFEGAPLPKQQMRVWAEKALAAGNEGLAAQITNLLLQFNAKGSADSRAKKDAIKQIEERHLRMADLIEQGARNAGYESADQMPDDLRVDLYMAADRAAGALHLEQTQEMADYFNDEIYPAHLGGKELDVEYWADTKNFPEQNKLITGVMNDYGIVPASLSNFIVSTLMSEGGNTDLFMHAMELNRLLQNSSNLVSKLNDSSALGPDTARALSYIATTGNPGSWDEASVKETIANYNKPGFQLQDVWRELGPESRMAMDEMVNKFLLKKADPWGLNWDILGNDVAPLDPLMTGRFYQAMEGRAHQVDRNDPNGNNNKNLARQIVEQVSADFGYGLSEAGYSPMRVAEETGFIERDRYKFAYVWHHPEGTYNEPYEMDYVGKAVQKILDDAVKADPSLGDLQFKENVWMEYDTENSQASGYAFWRLKIDKVNEEPQYFESDLYLKGDVPSFHFEEARAKAAKQLFDERQAETRLTGQARLWHQSNRQWRTLAGDRPVMTTLPFGDKSGRN